MGCPPIRVRCRVRWSASEKGNGSGAGKVSSDDPWWAAIDRQYPFHLLSTKEIEGISSDIWMAINYFVRLPNVCSKIFDQLSNCKIYKLVDWRCRGAGCGSTSWMAMTMLVMLVLGSLASGSRNLPRYMLMSWVAAKTWRPPRWETWRVAVMSSDESESVREWQFRSQSRVHLAVSWQVCDMLPCRLSTMVRAGRCLERTDSDVQPCSGRE
jgi:hypothetical protein